jgi:hypothetical protein
MANPMQNPKEAAGNVADKAKDLASSAMDKTRDAASAVADKSKDLASRATARADDMAGRAGGALESAADTVRDRGPQSGMLGTATSKVADTLEGTGRYLREEGISGLAEDLTELVKRNPIPALLLGLGVGFLLARALSSSNN